MAGMSSEVCEKCGCELLPLNPEWGDGGDTPIEVPPGYIPCGVIDTGLVVRLVCEECYHAGKLESFSKEELYALHYAFGLEYQLLGRYVESVTAYRKALGVQVSVDVLVLAAEVEGMLGHSQEQEAHYKRALEVDPNDVLARRGLSGVYRNQGRYEEALKLLDRDIAQIGPTPDLMMERAELLFRLGRHDAAMLAFQTAKAAVNTDEDRDHFDRLWSRLAG